MGGAEEMDEGLAWIRCRTYGNRVADGCKVARRYAEAPP